MLVHFAALEHPARGRGELEGGATLRVEGTVEQNLTINSSNVILPEKVT
jgi:hypothetical protein